MFLTKHGHPSFLRIHFALLLCVCAALGVLGFTQDRNAVEKVLTALVMPPGLLWLLLLTATIQLWLPTKTMHSGPAGAAAVSLCFLLYSIAGNGLIANRIATTLEANYFSRNPLQESLVDVVIVLGGGGGQGANGRMQGNGAGDRLILAAQLYHQKIAQRFICTGQRIASMNASGVDPAEASRDILLKLGIPDSAVELAGGRNTSEELQAIGARFQNSKLRIGLLTSAWHLPRAMRLADRNGVQAIPLPSDFHSATGIEGLTIGQYAESMIPNGFALGATWSFAKEYLGMLVGR